MADWVEEMNPKRRGPEGIGGWLLVPLALLAITAIGQSVSYIGLVQILARPDGPDFFLSTLPRGELDRTAVLTAMLLDIVVTLLALYGLVAFLFRKRHVPRLMVVIFAFAGASAFINGARTLAYMGLFWSLTHTLSPANAVLAFVWGVSLFLAIVWIRYFQTSRRVKNTFVR